MKLNIFQILAQGALISAHYTFDSLIYNSITYSKWQYMRRWKGENMPIYEAQMKTPDLRCNVNASATTQTLTVQAGSKLGFIVPNILYHPGPTTGWMARLPEGKKIEAWDGSGEVWFKMYEDFPTWVTETIYGRDEVYNSSYVKWENMGRNNVSFPIPQSLPSGTYLFRAEQVGLHVAYPTYEFSGGGPQFFVSCAQIKVVGGGKGVPAPLVSFPGAYERSDPVLNIYYYNQTNTSYLSEPYMKKTHGPDIWKG